ncbi:MAG: hypothetical protein FWG31_06890 [Oscillospiraceae bacterium]|nr:hypothetical protein [Oscillospiraceae bacterium]
MKRNIIVAGVPRAGKSTLSRMLTKHGFTHISMDSIIAGFEKVFPETGINTYAGMSSLDTLITISEKIAPFINAMMSSGEYGEHGFGAVFDVYQLLPCDCVKHIKPQKSEIKMDSYDVKIICLGSSDVTPDERFTIQKQFDTERDYTFYKTDEELREGADYIVEQSHLIKSQCKQYGLPYYDTSYNRFETFEKIFRNVMKGGL